MDESFDYETAKLPDGSIEKCEPPEASTTGSLHWVKHAFFPYPRVWAWNADARSWAWIDMTHSDWLDGYSGGGLTTGAEDAGRAGYRYLGPAEYVAIAETHIQDLRSKLRAAEQTRDHFYKAFRDPGRLLGEPASMIGLTESAHIGLTVKIKDEKIASIFSASGPLTEKGLPHNSWRDKAARLTEQLTYYKAECQRLADGPPADVTPKEVATHFLNAERDHHRAQFPEMDWTLVRLTEVIRAARLHGRQSVAGVTEPGSHDYHGPVKGGATIPDPVHERFHGAVGDVLAGRVMPEARRQMQEALKNAPKEPVTAPRAILGGNRAAVGLFEW